MEATPTKKLSGDAKRRRGRGGRQAGDGSPKLQVLFIHTGVGGWGGEEETALLPLVKFRTTSEI